MAKKVKICGITTKKDGRDYVKCTKIGKIGIKICNTLVAGYGKGFFDSSDSRPFMMEVEPL